MSLFFDDFFLSLLGLKSSTSSSSSSSSSSTLTSSQVLKEQVNKLFKFEYKLGEGTNGMTFIVTNNFDGKQYLAKMSNSTNKNVDSIEYEYVIGLLLSEKMKNIPNFSKSLGLFMCPIMNITNSKTNEKSYTCDFKLKINSNGPNNDIRSNVKTFIVNELILPPNELLPLVKKPISICQYFYQMKKKNSSYDLNKAGVNLYIQLLAILQMAQNIINLTHNDLHSNNILVSDEHIQMVKRIGYHMGLNYTPKIFYDYNGIEMSGDFGCLKLIDFGMSHVNTDTCETTIPTNNLYKCNPLGYKNYLHWITSDLFFRKYIYYYIMNELKPLLPTFKNNKIKINIDNQDILHSEFHSYLQELCNNMIPKININMKYKGNTLTYESIFKVENITDAILLEKYALKKLEYFPNTASASPTNTFFLQYDVFYIYLYLHSNLKIINECVCNKGGKFYAINPTIFNKMYDVYRISSSFFKSHLTNIPDLTNVIDMIHKNFSCSLYTETFSAVTTGVFDHSLNDPTSILQQSKIFSTPSYQQTKNETQEFSKNKLLITFRYTLDGKQIIDYSLPNFKLELCRKIFETYFTSFYYLREENNPRLKIIKELELLHLYDDFKPIIKLFDKEGNNIRNKTALLKNFFVSVDE
jgi:hypothetical protein